MKGGCRIDNWDPDGLAQLGHELEKGEATLGRDEEGSVKRVVSVAKPVRPATYFLLLDLGLSFCRCLSLRSAVRSAAAVTNKK